MILSVPLNKLFLKAVMYEPASGSLLSLLSHGQKFLHLFSDSKTYLKQMGPIPSSLRVLRALNDALVKPST